MISQTVAYIEILTVGVTHEAGKPLGRTCGEEQYIYCTCHLPAPKQRRNKGKLQEIVFLYKYGRNLHKMGLSIFHQGAE